ncbi:MAG TPA: hypothetical protein VLS49_06235 [Usitatibacter sp.]|nr:hypothetical protein [Usitatibacter sp.]
MGRSRASPPESADRKPLLDGPAFFLVPIAAFLGAIIVAVVVHAVLDQFHLKSLADIPAYRNFVDGAARIGRYMLAASVAIGLALLAALSACAIKHGARDDCEGKTVKLEGVGVVGTGLPVGTFDARMLASRHAFAPLRSASWRERLFSLGIRAFLACFFLVFVAAGLLLMRDLAILVLLPVLPGIFLYRIVGRARRDSRELNPHPASGDGTPPGSFPPSP